MGRQGPWPLQLPAAQAHGRLCTPRPAVLDRLMAPGRPARALHTRPFLPGLAPLPARQVLVLSAGQMLYFGPREGMVPWFGSLGYVYDASMHGVPSDWCDRVWEREGAPCTALARRSTRHGAAGGPPTGKLLLSAGLVAAQSCGAQPR